MEIIWHGHSCFELVSGGFSMVLDPYYHRELCGYPELHLTADAVLCSHGHYGHGWTEAVELRRGGAADPFEVEVLETYHDVLGGRLRGENRIHILRAEGLKIVHLGDLGCRLTEEQAERIRDCDAIMAPAGGILTIEPYAAYEICIASGARVVLPMHYGGGGRGNRRLRPVDEFASLFSEALVRRYETDRLELTAETPAQVAILTPPELHRRA